jgi:hypothetical protein
MEKLQIVLNRLGEWEVENAMVINPAKSKTVCFTRARVAEPLNYSLRGIVIPEASSCKYNFTQRFKLAQSSKLHGEKSL